MQVKAKYSHLNGEEYLLVHHEALRNELLTVIDGMDAEACRTKISKEKRTKGRKFYFLASIRKAKYCKTCMKKPRRFLLHSINEPIGSSVVEEAVATKHIQRILFFDGSQGACECGGSR